MEVDGSYTVEITSQAGNRSVNITLKADGNKLSGTFSGFATASFDNGTIDGDKLSWSVNLPTPQGNMQVDMTGTLDGDKITGNIQFGARGSGTFVATRT